MARKSTPTEAVTILATLTEENAHLVSTVISIENPEWGIKAFQYRKQPLLDGLFPAHVIGFGSSGFVLNSNELRFWGVTSWKE